MLYEVITRRGHRAGLGVHVRLHHQDRHLRPGQGLSGGNAAGLHRRPDSYNFV